MRRREFVSLMVPAIAFWPRGASAQDSGRRVGVLMSFAANDPEGKARVAAFEEGLQQLGWSDGRNVRIDVRWREGDADRIQAAEALVALKPDVILASTSTGVAALQKVTSTVPIVFANVVDPVGAGFVESLSRPGGNTTGFSAFEFSIGGKWLELLKEVAPEVRRIAVLRDSAIAAATAQFAAIQAMRPPSSGVELTTIDLRNAPQIVDAISAFSKEPNGGLIVTASQTSLSNRDLIISLAARFRLPAVYPFRFYAAGGGLVSFGPDPIDQHKRAASYVDRILKGEKPGDLPVQSPIRYELVINLQTAKKLGLELTAPLLARADEVIE
jgi:putative tryptophan/tyrosine transport system substrate-binding protein